MKKTTAERFWVKVDKTGQCWIWTAATGSDSYGRFRGPDGKSVLAHRYSFEAEHGPIDDGLQVDHVCHDRRCVNPAHLRLATNKQNSEHLTGPYANNRSSGVRNVYWHKRARKWYVSVGHNGKLHYKGLFDDKAEAESVALRTRMALFTHNAADRSPL